MLCCKNVHIYFLYSSHKVIVSIENVIHKFLKMMEARFKAPYTEK